jgi:hypothetical protein
MKVVIELSPEHHAVLLKHVVPDSPVYSLLRSGFKLSRSDKGVEKELVAVLCDEEEAKLLRDFATQFCRAATTEIDKAVLLARFKMT